MCGSAFAYLDAENSITEARNNENTKCECIKESILSCFLHFCGVVIVPSYRKNLSAPLEASIFGRQPYSQIISNAAYQHHPWQFWPDLP